MINKGYITKQIMRAPVKSCIVAAILAAVSTMFINRACEYYVASRELEKQLSFYEVYGTICVDDTRLSEYLSSEKGGSDKELNSYGERSYWVNYPHTVPLTSEDIDVLEQSEYIEALDRRKVGAGLSDNLYVIAEPSFTSRYNSQFSMLGTFGQDSVFVIMDTEENRVLKVLTGHPDRISEGDVISINWNEELYPFVEAYKQQYSSNKICFMALVSRENSGKTYDLNIFCPAAVTPIVDYPETEESDLQALNSISKDDLFVMYGYAGGQTANELRQVVSTNLHTFNMVYTLDTTLLPASISGNMYIVNGRHLAEEDSLNKRDVCVISADLANKYGIQVGDRIELNLRQSSSVHEGSVYGPILTYIPAEETMPKLLLENNLWSRKLNYPEYTWEPEQFNRLPVEQRSFEIIGIYAYAKYDPADDQCFLLNTIFLPRTIYDKLSGGEASPDYPSTITFKLTSPEVKSLFLDEVSASMSNRNLIIQFYEYGSDEIVTGFRKLIENTRLSLIISGVASGVALILAQFLYISGKRLEYGIMRAMGTPKRDTNRMYFTVLFILGLISCSIGGVVGWNISSKSIQKAFSSIDALEQLVLDSSVPIFIPIIGVILLLVILLGALAFELLKTGRKPPLSLLQGGFNTSKIGGDGSKKPVQQQYVTNSADIVKKSDHAKIIKILNTSKVNHSIDSRANKNISYIFIARHVLKHICRSRVKSIITGFGVSLLLIIVVQYKEEMIQREDQIHAIYDTADVIGYINNKTGATSIEVPYSLVKKIQESKFVDTFYAEAVDRLYYLNPRYSDTSQQQLQMYSFNDISRFEYNDMIDVTYADGFASDLFAGKDNVCVIDAEVMETLGCSFGDAIQVAGLYTKDFGDGDGIKLTIVGSFAPKGGAKLSEALSGCIMVPLRTIGEKSKEYYLDSTFSSYCHVAEFHIDNQELYELDAFKTYLAEIFDSSDSHISQLLFVMKDEEFRLVIKPLEKITALMTYLFPIIMLTICLIIAVISAYMVLQQSMDAVVMRALGMPALKIVVQQVLEQILLCFAGVILGLLFLKQYHGSNLTLYTETIRLASILLLASCGLGAAIASLTVNLHRVLDRLQIKD